MSQTTASGELSLEDRTKLQELRADLNRRSMGSGILGATIAAASAATIGKLAIEKRLPSSFANMTFVKPLVDSRGKSVMVIALVAGTLSSYVRAVVEAQKGVDIIRDIQLRRLAREEEQGRRPRIPLPETNPAYHVLASNQDSYDRRQQAIQQYLGSQGGEKEDSSSSTNSFW